MESLAGVLIALISATGGIVTKYFLDSWKEARQGRKNEAQRIADQRDEARRARDQERRCKQDWQDAFWQARAIAMHHGVPPDVLPQAPDRRRTENDA